MTIANVEMAVAWDGAEGDHWARQAGATRTKGDVGLQTAGPRPPSLRRTDRQASCPLAGDLSLLVGHLIVLARPLIETVLQKIR